MTPADRAALIARAKSLAPGVASCVAARLRPDHLLSERSRDELMAVIIVLAESHDPTLLRAVCAAPGDDGRADSSFREAMLRRAHTQAEARRRANLVVPERLKMLEREYYREAKRAVARRGRGNAA